jgi:hypothetical protein
MTENLRNQPLPTLVDALKTRRTRVLDVVAEARSLSFDGGAVVLRGTEPEMTEDGVTVRDGLYYPTVVGEEGLAGKLDIPVRYLRRMRETGAVDMYDYNLNGWLSRAEEGKRYMLRLLRGDDGGPGILRAFLGDTYKTIDDFDVLLATLRGITEAGVTDPQITADITDRRMYLKVVAPQIKAYAPELLAGYRSPFDGGQVGNGWTPERVARAAAGEAQAYDGGAEPVIFAGFVVTNSETGNGGFNITPRLEVQVCRNGLTIAADVQRRIHLGSKLDDGIVKYSTETAQANLALVKSQTADAVRTFLDVDYVKAKIAAMEKVAGVQITKPQEVIESVSRTVGFSQAEADAILGRFIQGGQMTAGGVMQAVTAAAQDMDSGDAADAMERAAMQVLELAAKAAR